MDAGVRVPCPQPAWSPSHVGACCYLIIQCFLTAEENSLLFFVALLTVHNWEGVESMYIGALTMLD